MFDQLTWYYLLPAIITAAAFLIGAVSIGQALRGIERELRRHNDREDWRIRREQPRGP